ncbi:MAG: UDP-2,3-diacylglucosamine diphosphatase [Bacteroidales bacterium]|nr:UDP-2,3-diacylglucosamine diphosphatase [Bacteroidales bacterium]
MSKRNVDIVVISDVHLGTYGCHAKELLTYLKSVKPKTLILNGDIIDIWQFSKRYWPKTHMKVIKQVIGMAAKGVKTYYITGNHDEMLRKFSGLKIGSLEITNQLVLDIDDKKAWFFHGDVFDVVIQNSKWLAKLGSIGYDALIVLNNIVNRINRFLGKGKVSISKRIKDNVKTAVKYINRFEETAAQVAASKGYSYIVCGHIHKAEIRKIEKNRKKIVYMNSGDWVENLTALEYKKGKWKIYTFSENYIPQDNDNTVEDGELALADYGSKELFNFMLNDIQKDIKN